MNPLKLSKEKWRQAISRLPQIQIAVAGDLILDEYLMGKVNRISPEAPVPVVWVREEKQTLGGSGNVVKNLHALGVRTLVLGRIGSDKAGETVQLLLKEQGVPKASQLLLQSSLVPTILKTRIIAGNQQICRVDREEIVPLDANEESQVQNYLVSLPNNLNAVILSDYDKGFFTELMIRSLIQFSLGKKIPVVVDPQVSHFFSYKGIHNMTPNHHEAGRALGRTLNSSPEVESACKDIATQLQTESIMITRGEKGMSIYLSSEDTFFHIPTVAKEVFDVTGAGDTVISVYTAFLACGLSVVESALVANSAAGIVVGKLGAATASVSEIESYLQQMDLFQG